MKVTFEQLEELISRHRAEQNGRVGTSVHPAKPHAVRVGWRVSRFEHGHEIPLSRVYQSRAAAEGYLELARVNGIGSATIVERRGADDVELA
ncbi:MAG TPA: hypothetical protein VF814_07740 [Casimicrobiaceae bacterium]